MTFETTRWSLVLAAAGNDSQAAREALSSLCQTYWYPLYAYLRRRGLDPEDARERISAVVDMTRPGVWILGDVGEDRDNGMGIVVEYAGATGKPVWTPPPPFKWDYTRFGRAGSTPPRVDETIEMTFTKDNAELDGFNQWRINGMAFSMDKKQPLFTLRRGARYRLRMRNGTDDIHPFHLHRQSFEITSVAGRPAGGIVKDVAMLNGYQIMEVDFTANATGLSLFHCHQQLHMDFGFMALLDCR